MNRMTEEQDAQWKIPPRYDLMTDDEDDYVEDIDYENYTLRESDLVKNDLNLKIYSRRIAPNKVMYKGFLPLPEGAYDAYNYAIDVVLASAYNSGTHEFDLIHVNFTSTVGIRPRGRLQYSFFNPITDVGIYYIDNSTIMSTFTMYNAFFCKNCKIKVRTATYSWCPFCGYYRNK